MEKGTTSYLKGTELQFWFGSQFAKRISQYCSNFFLVSASDQFSMTNGYC